MSKNPALRRVLIVDDEFVIAFDLEASMRELGFKVCDVASTKEMRLNWPCVTRRMWWSWMFTSAGTCAGIEAARWLREVCGVPIVFVTGHNDDSTLERIRTVVPGAAVLSKPVYPDKLADAVSGALH